MNEAAQILHDYNTRLSIEMEERKKLTQMLKDFQAEQKELLAQAEQRLEVYKIFFSINFTTNIHFLPKYILYKEVNPI